MEDKILQASIAITGLLFELVGFVRLYYLKSIPFKDAKSLIKNNSLTSCTVTVDKNGNLLSGTELSKNIDNAICEMLDKYHTELINNDKKSIVPFKLVWIGTLLQILAIIASFRHEILLVIS